MFLKVNSKKDLLIHLGVIIGILMVLIFFFFSIYLPLTTHHGEAIKVPDLKGKTVDQLENFLDEHQLRYEINDSTYVAGAVPFSVISQHPLAGSEVKANRRIYITVTSQKPPMVLMPELKDKSLKAAAMEIKSRDLILDPPRSVPSPFVDLVIRQYVDGREITAGTLIPKGTHIILDVGNGSGELGPADTGTETETAEPENQ